VLTGGCTFAVEGVQKNVLWTFNSRVFALSEDPPRAELQRWALYFIRLIQPRSKAERGFSWRSPSPRGAAQLC